MNSKTIKHELQDVLSGKSGSSHDAAIQAVARYLSRSKSAGPMAEEKHQHKAEETEKLLVFAEKNNLFYPQPNEENYIAEGAEQKVYIRNEEYVIKLNDAIYYASWQDYFHNLLLHNYFFADVAYQFMGFTVVENALHAVVKADAITSLEEVKSFMLNNGFKNTRNHDYYHTELGIILEDLHDENVLTQNKMLYFIDTVFYINPNVFWESTGV
jgi:hypothetical protein